MHFWETYNWCVRRIKNKIDSHNYATGPNHKKLAHSIFAIVKNYVFSVLFGRLYISTFVKSRFATARKLVTFNFALSLYSYSLGSKIRKDRRRRTQCSYKQLEQTRKRTKVAGKADIASLNVLHKTSDMFAADTGKIKEDHYLDDHEPEYLWKTLHAEMGLKSQKPFYMILAGASHIATKLCKYHSLALTRPPFYESALNKWWVFPLLFRS